MNIQEKVEAYLGKPVAQASNKEIYDGLLTVVQEMAAEKERTDSKKKLYYISAEFLIGKLLSNNIKGLPKHFIGCISRNLNYGEVVHIHINIPHSWFVVSERTGQRSDFAQIEVDFIAFRTVKVRSQAPVKNNSILRSTLSAI